MIGEPRVELLLNALSAAFALLAAIFWIVSARVETRAPSDSGIGSGWDGHLVGLNAAGKPIHLVPTLQAQARWNARAAVCAAIAAVFQVAQMLLTFTQ